LDTLNRFSTITAQQRFVANRAFRWSDLLVRPLIRFVRGYVFKRGFMDGAHGLILAVLNSYGVFVKYAKLWELRRRQSPVFKELPESAETEK